MIDYITQVHIPRTGGTALRHAMGACPWWRMLSHEHILPEVDGRAVVTVRDPVARFVSVCKWGRDVLANAGYRDAEALALDIEVLPALQQYRVMLAPQTHWLISSEYVLSRCLWVGHVETLDADFDRLKASLGLDGEYRLPAVGEIKRNAAPDLGYELGPLALANVRDWYAADMALVEAV